MALVSGEEGNHRRWKTLCWRALRAKRTKDFATGDETHPKGIENGAILSEIAFGLFSDWYLMLQTHFTPL